MGVFVSLVYYDNQNITRSDHLYHNSTFHCAICDAAAASIFYSQQQAKTDATADG